MNDRKLQEAKTFKGSYKGIYFLISHHGYGDDYRPDGTWCYYLLINEKQLPDKYRKDFILEPVFDNKNRLSHNYMTGKIADLDWHCGITYYSKEGGADNEPIVIKAGCDYGHYWDEGNFYNETSVLLDVNNSIDKLFEMFPDIKIYSSYYGGYFNLSEGEFNEHGNFVAFEEKKQWDIDQAEREAKKA